MAYELCSLICEDHRGLKDRENLLLLLLEIGFRRLDPRHWWIRDLQLTHTERHQGLVDAVFKSSDDEAVADLLHAWTVCGPHHKPARTLLGICTGHLTDLHNRVPFSSRLRRLVLRSVEVIGYKGFEGVGMGRFVKLLNSLHVAVEDIDVNRTSEWVKLLSDTLQSSEGIQHLSHWYWELLVELAISRSHWLSRGLTYNPSITISLAGAGEWDKLEYWLGTVWIIAADETTEDLERLVLLLFRQRPGAVQKLTHWMERWSKKSGKGVPESFERICTQAREAAQQDLP